MSQNTRSCKTQTVSKCYPYLTGRMIHFVTTTLGNLYVLVNICINGPKLEAGTYPEDLIPFYLGTNTGLIVNMILATILDIPMLGFHDETEVPSKRWKLIIIGFQVATVFTLIGLDIALKLLWREGLLG